MSADDEGIRSRLWAAETAPLPAMPEDMTGPLRPVEIPAARAVVMRLSRLGDVARVFNRNATVFVLLPDPPPEGTDIECVLVHPDDESEVKVMAEVVRVGKTLAGTGVELRFYTPDDALRSRLIQFVKGS